MSGVADPGDKPATLLGYLKAHLVLKICEALLADPVIAVVSHVTALDGFDVVAGRCDADVPLAGRAMIVVPALAVPPPGAQMEGAPRQVSFLSYEPPVHYLPMMTHGRTDLPR